MATQEKKLEALQLIGARPGLRTIELSDLMDMEIGDVKKILAELANSRTIQVHDVIAPNGKEANAYTLHGIPMPSKKVEAEEAVVGTKTDRAVAFIRKSGGSVSGAEMHAMLGLKSEEYPTQYLKGGIASGRLCKDGKEWTLGPAEDSKIKSVSPMTPPPKPPFSINAVKESGPVAKFDHKAPLEVVKVKDVPEVADIHADVHRTVKAIDDAVECKLKAENFGDEIQSFGSTDVFYRVADVPESSGGVIADGSGASVVGYRKTPEIFPFPTAFRATFKPSPDQVGALKAVFDSLPAPGEMPAEMVIGGEVVARGTVSMPVTPAEQLFDDLEKSEDFISNAIAASSPTTYSGIGHSEIDKDLIAVAVGANKSCSDILQAAELAFSPAGPTHLGGSVENLLSDWSRAKNFVQSNPVKVDHEETTFAVWSNGDFQIAVNGKVAQTLAAKDVDAMREYLALFPTAKDIQP